MDATENEVGLTQNKALAKETSTVVRRLATGVKASGTVGDVASKTASYANIRIKTAVNSQALQNVGIEKAIADAEGEKIALNSIKTAVDPRLTVINYNVKNAINNSSVVQGAKRIKTAVNNNSVVQSFKETKVGNALVEKVGNAKAKVKGLPSWANKKTFGFTKYQGSISKKVTVASKTAKATGRTAQTLSRVSNSISSFATGESMSQQVSTGAKNIGSFIGRKIGKSVTNKITNVAKKGLKLVGKGLKKMLTKVVIPLGSSLKIPTLCICLIVSVCALGNTTKQDDNTVSLMDILVNYHEITDDFKGDDWDSWLSTAREEIHSMRQSSVFDYESDASQQVKDTKKRQEAMAIAVLYYSWLFDGESFIPSSYTKDWDAYANCFTGNDFTVDSYDVLNDSTWNNLENKYNLGIKKPLKDSWKWDVVMYAQDILESIGGAVEQAIEWALTIASDNSIGYSNDFRYGNPDYDCSSFVTRAFQVAGFDVEFYGAVTSNMKERFTKAGFEWIPFSEIKSDDELQRGDILLDEDSHTELYIGALKTVGARGGNQDGIVGSDSLGTEISVCLYNYKYVWGKGVYYRNAIDGVLRYKG